MKASQPPSDKNRDYERDFGYVSRTPPPPKPPRLSDMLGWALLLALAFIIFMLP